MTPPASNRLLTTMQAQFPGLDWAQPHEHFSGFGGLLGHQGHLTVLQALATAEPVRTVAMQAALSAALTMAAKAGHVEVVKFLIGPQGLRANFASRQALGSAYLADAPAVVAYLLPQVAAPERIAFYTTVLVHLTFEEVAPALARMLAQDPALTEHPLALVRLATQLLVRDYGPHEAAVVHTLLTHSAPIALLDARQAEHSPPHDRAMDTLARHLPLAEQAALLPRYPGHLPEVRHRLQAHARYTHLTASGVATSRPRRRA